MAPPRGNPGADMIGQVLDSRYRVLDTLGSGGFGLVLKVEHQTLQKVQALKLLHRTASDNPKVIKRFEREARSTCNLGHEHIIDITDFGFDEKHGFYFVMEYLDGLPLGDVIKNAGAMPPRRVLHIIKQICDALAAVHQQSIIHRDLKPANIFVLQKPRKPDFVKVLDFGIAAMKLGEGEERLTQAGMVLGSPSYMSPEQALGKELDARSDLYALGIIMHQMLAGQVPFQANSDLMVIRKHLREPPPALRQCRPDLQIPAQVEQIVLRLLEKNPDMRFQTADQLIDAIEAVEATLGGGGVAAAPVVSAPPAAEMAPPRRSAPPPAAAPLAPPPGAGIVAPKTMALPPDLGTAVESAKAARPQPPRIVGRAGQPAPVQAPAPRGDDLDGPRTVLVDEDANRAARPVPPPTIGRGRSQAIRSTLGPSSEEEDPMKVTTMDRGGAPPRAPVRSAPPPDDEEDGVVKTMAIDVGPRQGPPPGGARPQPSRPAPPPARPGAGSLMADDDDDEGVVKTMAIGAMPRPGAPVAPPPRAPQPPVRGMMSEDEEEGVVKTMALDVGARPSPQRAPSPAAGSLGGSLGGGVPDEVKTMALDAMPRQPAPSSRGGGGPAGWGGGGSGSGRSAAPQGGDDQERRTMALDPSAAPPPSAGISGPVRLPTGQLAPPGYKPGQPMPSGQYGPAPQWRTGAQPVPGQTGNYGTVEMVRDMKAQKMQRLLYLILIPLLLGGLGALIFLIVSD